MRYQGSEAYSWENAERRRERRTSGSRPPFFVMAGGGLDARVRQGVSPQFVARLRAAIAVTAVFIALGIARVALTSATVAELRAGSTLKSEIAEAQTLNDDLKVECAVMSGNARISRIATQNYGMVLSTTSVVLDVTPTETGSATTLTTSKAAGAAQSETVSADGDTVPSTNEAGGQSSDA